MKTRTIIAAVAFGTMALASCGEHSHEAEKPEIDKANLKQLEKEADEKMEALDNTLQDVESKEAELDEALDNLDF